jgi:hypothetical protein
VSGRIGTVSRREIPHSLTHHSNSSHSVVNLNKNAIQSSTLNKLDKIVCHSVLDLNTNCGQLGIPEDDNHVLPNRKHCHLGKQYLVILLRFKTSKDPNTDWPPSSRSQYLSGIFTNQKTNRSLLLLLLFQYRLV